MAHTYRSEALELLKELLGINFKTAAQSGDSSDWSIISEKLETHPRASVEVMNEINKFFHSRGPQEPAI